MCVAIVFHLMHIVLAVQGIRLAIAVLAYVLSRDKSNQDWSCEVAGVLSVCVLSVYVLMLGHFYNILTVGQFSQKLSQLVIVTGITGYNTM